MAATTTQSSKPWYREPWPWFLMSGPIIVIIAALTSAWIAIKSSDGLVSEDYYKQGLAAGETLARSRHAAQMGITAGLRMSEDSVSVRLSAEQAAMTMPASLHVTLSHPTRAGIDQKSVLLRQGGAYVGKLNLPASGHWLVVIEDDARTWRLMGSVVLPVAKETVIGGGDSASAPQS